MYKSIYKIIILFYLSLVFISCSINNLSERRRIRNLVMIDSLRVDFNFDKACYSHTDRIFYLLNTNSNEIYIYNKSGLINTIGKPGFEKENFRKLSDITIGIDGHLYALDSFEKSIKKFNKDGVFLTQINLDNVISPEKFAFTNYGSLLIFDAHRKEILYLDAFDFKTKFTFGKFQIEKAEFIVINGSYLSVYDLTNHETLIFSINGQFENSMPFKGINDSYNNLITLKDNSIVVYKTDDVLHKEDILIKYYSISSNLLCVATNKYIKIFEINYETF